MQVLAAATAMGQSDCEHIVGSPLAQPVLAITSVAYVAAGLAPTVRSRRRVWMTAAGIFALALIAYAAGRSGSPVCRPDSLWQYHGAWHVLSAAAAGWAALAMGHRAGGDLVTPDAQSDL